MNNIFIQDSNATVFKLLVLLLTMEGNEKSESSYYSLSYHNRCPSYSPCCSYVKNAEYYILMKYCKCNTFQIIRDLVHDFMTFNAREIIQKIIKNN